MSIMKKKYAGIVSGLTKMVDQLDELKVQEQFAISKSNEKINKEQEKKAVSEKEISAATKTANALRELLG